MVFRKIKPNPFLITKKATSTFQILLELISDAYPNKEACNAPHKVENWIRWIPPSNGRFKLNLNGSMINSISVSRWVIRDSNGINKVARSRYLDNVSINYYKMCSFERWFFTFNTQ